MTDLLGHSNFTISGNNVINHQPSPPQTTMNPQNNSALTLTHLQIDTHQRQSNFELLRILAMFLVLVVHADCWTLGFPENADFIEEPLQSFTKVVIESAAIVCVNVFVLISGWFGIKPSIKGLSNFIFQCIYFLFGIYMVLILIGKTDLSFQGIAYCLCLSEWNWFIKAYATLYILSPILNAFVAKASKKEFASVLLVFFIFQTVYGWSGAAKFVEGGYSSFSFIGLYLLSKYVKTYGLKFVTHWGGGYFTCCQF